ncbi:MAG: UvrD-helicase domain-containing protein [Spirochaetia bacterium]|jgi:superfamily I DNA/RNA helicase|nr:UvrD-helicase domain-containing protein [Spirochaetia bacterium]
MSNRGKETERKLERLSRMVGSDEGFYVLAIHSFIEFFLRNEKKYGDELSFPELIWQFRDKLLEERSDEFIEGLSCIPQIGHQHTLTNRVRHLFEEMDKEEARCATHLFLRFCSLAGIEESSLGRFLRDLEAWNDRSSFIEQSNIIKGLNEHLITLQKKNMELSFQIENYRELKEKIHGLEIFISLKNLEIEKTAKKVKEKDEKLDILRKERHALLEEKNRLTGEKELYSDLEKYLEYLGRLTVYTRSRMDYERSLSELSPEQKEAVLSFSYGRDFLLRGEAGTGKSIVLIEAMRRFLEQGQLDFFDDKKIVLITFTRTLIKYSRYIAKIMKMDVPVSVFSTVDNLINEMLLEIDSSIAYDFNIFKSFSSEEILPDLMSKEYLQSEIDDFLLGFAVEQKDYISGEAKREGLAGRLTGEKRKAVWEIRERYVSYMEKKKLYSINYARLRLYKYLNENPQSAIAGRIRHIFIDEIQDINPAALLALKKLASGHIFMAGDYSQTLYMPQPPFTRAGIDIRGSVKVLKTNFRNTKNIISTAEAFRKSFLGLNVYGDDDNLTDTAVTTLRSGPEPELYAADSTEDLETLIIKRTNIFIDELGYDPSNICILVPRNSHIDRLTEIFSHTSEKLSKITEENFDFMRTSGKSVNISTIHSSKGLDFPVILLYLPEIVRYTRFSPETEESLAVNLVYVALTRAMDHLNVFVKESDDMIINALKKSFRTFTVNNKEKSETQEAFQP